MNAHRSVLAIPSSGYDELKSVRKNIYFSRVRISINKLHQEKLIKKQNQNNISICNPCRQTASNSATSFFMNTFSKQRNLKVGQKKGQTRKGAKMKDHVPKKDYYLIITI